MNEAVAYWRELQAGIPDSEAWTRSALDAQSAAGLMYKGKPAMAVAEPSFVTQRQVAQDQQVCAAVVAALVASGERVLADKALQERYVPGWLDGVPDADLFMLPSGYSEPIVFGRLDGVRTPEGLRFLEFNGGLPGGILPADSSAAVLGATDLASQFGQRFGYSTSTAGPDVIAAMVDTWHDFGGSGLPNTVVAMPKELTEIAAPAIGYLSGIAETQGIELAVADPGELAFGDGRLRLGGREVDVLVRAFFTPMLAYLGERLDGIKAALRAGDVCMITSLQSGLFGLKSLFAMVTDPTVDLDVSAEELAVVRDHLPWTRMVGPGPSTGPDGDRVELLEYLASHRDELVIKPTEGYGGSGVELGWEHSDDTWRDVIANAASGPHVVQQRVPILAEEFSVLEPGFPVQAFTTDHNPLLCAGKVAGYYVRLAPEGSGITNVTGGGATVAPTFILRD